MWASAPAHRRVLQTWECGTWSSLIFKFLRFLSFFLLTVRCPLSLSLTVRAGYRVQLLRGQAAGTNRGGMSSAGSNRGGRLDGPTVGA